MSAICGVVGLDGRPWGRSDLDGVLRMLAPLGPHGGGAWEGTAGRCGVALAVGLRHSTAEDLFDDQPARNDDDSVVLVADARIDNRPDLAAPLAVRDDRTTPDSVFVLRAYEKWGDAFLDRIVGEFALAIVDHRRGGVLIARDHVGARPLLVHERGGVLAFSSTALSLAALEGVGRRLDERHAAEVLALAFSSGTTFVQGVRWFPPGEAWWVDAETVRRRAWWTVDPDDVVDLGSPAAHEEVLRDAFDRAVVSALRSRGRLGAMISGGLDSTSVAATAARILTPAHLPTYTAAPPPGWSGPERAGSDNDESPLVRALADMHPNMHPSFVHVATETDLLSLQEPLWEAGAAPARNPCNLSWVQTIRNEAAADGVATLLTGDVGNLFFSADGPQWLYRLLRSGRLGAFVREAGAWTSASGEGWYRTLRRHVVAYALPVHAFRLALKASGRASALDEWMEASALRRDIAAGLDLPRLVPHLDDSNRADFRKTRFSMRLHHAGLADVTAALAAVTGVETRDPTADRRVVEAAIRQPEWVRRREGLTRAVARRAMADRLPAAIALRTRHGEQLPEWLDVMTAQRDALSAELEQIEGHSPARSLIDTQRLRNLLVDWPSRERAADMTVYRSYRLALLRALVVGRYLRWFEQTSP